MCECGCTLNDDRYTLPGPKGLLYLVTLSAACKNCDAPPGVTIERFRKGTHNYEYALDPDEGAEPLPFEKWHDGDGVCITAGMTKDQLVKALTPYLTSVDMSQMIEKTEKHLDKYAAEVLIEEMYDDATVAPRIVTPAVPEIN